MRGGYAKQGKANVLVVDRNGSEARSIAAQLLESKAINPVFVTSPEDALMYMANPTNVVDAIVMVDRKGTPHFSADMGVIDRAVKDYRLIVGMTENSEILSHADQSNMAILPLQIGNLDNLTQLLSDELRMKAPVPVK